MKERVSKRWVSKRKVSQGYSKGSYSGLAEGLAAIQQRVLQRYSGGSRSDTVKGLAAWHSERSPSKIPEELGGLKRLHDISAKNF